MKSKARNRGITLITLIITVVVMLILAGVAIAQFTGGDGIFSRVTDATREYKKQSMLEAVDLAKAYLEMEKTYKNEPITITDVIDKVKEISSINDEDYIITIDDEEQSATIIDKQTGVVIDIWIDENGEIQVEGSIVDDIENVVKPTITYTLDPPAGTYGEAVKITITATEEKNGIVRMVLPDNSEIIYNNEKTVTREYTVTENGTYKFTVEGANGRETTKYVKVDNIMSASEIVMEVQNTNPTNQNVSIKITYDENVKSGGQVLINADRFQYSIGENNWQIATEAETTISVGVNGIVYARYYDGTTGFKTKSIEIENIDKEKPVISSATASTSWGETNSVTITATDTGTSGCATENTGIVCYGINQSSTTEPSYTTVTVTTSLNTTINNITSNGTYYVWVKDQAGNRNNTAVTVNRIDTIPPTVATIESSNVEETTFKLIVRGEDGESGVAKYEFYINGDLSNTVETSQTEATYDMSGKTPGTTYRCKVIVYDAVGLSKESEEIEVTTKSTGTPIASVVSVGDYVNYDAGTWNQSTDTSKITSSGGTVTWSSSKPTSQGQFGGFTNGQSRNSNSTPYSTSYTPDYSGWRVWDIDESTREITLISAGHPETYYHGTNSSTSTNILRNRDWSMYENQYAKSGSAEVLTKEEFDRWYKKYIDSRVDDTWDVSTFPAVSTQPLITLAENGSYFWLASPYSTDGLYCVLPYFRNVYYSRNSAFGVRVLVSLKSDVQVKEGTATGGVTTWDIVGN